MSEVDREVIRITDLVLSVNEIDPSDSAPIKIMKWRDPKLFPTRFDVLWDVDRGPLRLDIETPLPAEYVDLGYSHRIKPRFQNQRGIDYLTFDALRKWANEFIPGVAGDGNRTILFRKEADALAFRMRWSGLQREDIVR